MTVRARDLRVAIKDMGFERGVVHVLELMLEEQGEMRQTLRMFGEVCEGCVGQVEKMVQIGTGMQHIIDDIKRITEHGDVDDQKGQE